MELDEIKQVSKELEDILEGFPDVPKEPMLQKVKDIKNQLEDEEAAALDSEIDDLEPEAAKFTPMPTFQLYRRLPPSASL